MDGFDAGIKAVEREHKRGLLGTEAVERAKTSADLVRSTMTAGADEQPTSWGRSGA
jgi:hypothetical protein